MRLEGKTDAEVISDSLYQPEVFGEIFNRHVRSLYRYVGRRTAPSVDLPAIVGEVFERAFKNRSRYDPAYSSCLPWLKGFARNVISETVKKDRSHRATALTYFEPEYGHEEATIDRLFAADASRELKQALQLLSDSDRETFLLVVAGKSYPEVARELGIPDGTVASRVNRARRVVREALANLGPIDSELPESESST